MTITPPQLRCIPLVGMVLIGLSVQAHAKPLNWIDPQIPSALAPFADRVDALATLAEDNILIYQHPRQATATPTERGVRHYQNVSFNSSALVVSATPREVRQLLSDYRNHVGLFPTLTEAKPLSSQNGISQMQYRIQVPVPIPLLSFDEKIILQHQLEEHRLSTLMIDAPIQYGLGQFEWFGLPNGKTLVTLTQ